MSVPQDFLPPLFHDLNLSVPLMTRPEYFRIWFRFRREVRFFKKRCGIIDTAESDSAVGMTGAQMLSNKEK